ncbi:hypothetical protein PF005_g18603 [Phytophthora fragariae]|uniref:Uncharacterized protein n=3 Tax=Phytophthora fragariae TaxID=53985 RepID=A0A6A3RYC4_9STRA|nr:hypothetical protein PF003_g26428 [Phytophthora fragariae]KAE8929818.1 hypothetical protein PF009_g20077 [Phytophthora fragariae]KAE9102391.1 hypothetical protein PF006_g22440 [Phytophthora fragariae]KAE9192061.1 hypothetical protein PF005_g18603 [Phytophthora fragariae]KAE9205258.1 hypothetical protein PF002_g20384 [Phytophthora fragariae]
MSDSDVQPDAPPDTGDDLRAAVFAERGQSTQPPRPCKHCYQAPSDLSAAATPLEVDLRALQTAASSAHTFICAYRELLSKHQQAVRALIRARRHNEELHAQAHPPWDMARAFVDFAQHRYDVFQERVRQVEQQEADTRQVNEQLRDELKELAALKLRYSILEETSADSFARLLQYTVSVERCPFSERGPPRVVWSSLFRPTKVGRSYSAWRSVPRACKVTRDKPLPVAKSPLPPHPVTQDLLNVCDERDQLHQELKEFQPRLDTAESSRNTVLQDLFQLELKHADLRKSHTDLERYYSQWKARAEDLDRENRQLRRDLDHARRRLDASALSQENRRLRRDLDQAHQQLAGSATAADLQAARLEIHVRGEKIAELERLLAKANDRRAQLHRVHDRTVDKLDPANRTVQGLRRDLDSLRGGRHTDRLQTAQRQIQQLTQELDSLRGDSGHVRLQAAERKVEDLARELNSVRRQHAKAEDSLQGAQEACRGLNAERDRLIQDQDDAVQSLKHVNARASHHEAEIAQVGRIRQERDEFQQERDLLRQEQAMIATRVTELTAQLDQLSQDRDAAVSKRDEAIREGQRYYDSNRDLLAQIADMQHSYRLVRQDFDRVQDQQDSLRQERQDLLSSYASIAGERDCALGRLASIASTALHGTPAERGGQAASPTPDARSSWKRSRSPSPSSAGSGSSARKQARPNPPSADADSSTSVSDPSPGGDVPAWTPFLAIGFPAEEGGSDYEFPGSDPSSSGDESEVGSTYSSVGVDTPSSPADPAPGSPAVSAGPPDRTGSEFHPSATTPGPVGPQPRPPVAALDGSGAGPAAVPPTSGDPESPSPVIDPKISGAEPQTTSATPTPKSPVVSEDSDAIFDASYDESSQAGAPGSSPADSAEPDAVFEDSNDERLQVALARSRSDARPRAGARRRSSSSIPEDSSGSAAVPIVVDRSDEIGGDTESVPTEILEDPVSPGANVTVTAAFQPFAPVSGFVPGLHQSRDIPRSDVVPWDPA